MKWLSQLLHDHYGKPSSMRVALLAPIAIVFAVWAYLSLKNLAMADIPSGVDVLILGLVAGNIGKAAFEKATVTTETSSLITAEGASASTSKVSESTPPTEEPENAERASKEVPEVTTCLGDSLGDNVL